MRKQISLYNNLTELTLYDKFEISFLKNITALKNLKLERKRRCREGKEERREREIKKLMRVEKKESACGRE